MNIQPENKRFCRKLYVAATILGLLLYTVCFALARLEVIVTSDILLANGFLAQLLSLLQTLCIVFAFALFYSFTEYFIYNTNSKDTFLFMLIVLGITFYRSILSFCGKYLIDGVSYYDFLYVLLAQAIYFILEIAQYLLVTFIIWLIHKSTTPLPRALLFVSLIVMTINIASRIVTDIGIGAPTSANEVLQMVVAYSSDILLYGVLLFFAMRLFAALAKKLYQKEI